MGGRPGTGGRASEGGVLSSTMVAARLDQIGLGLWLQNLGNKYKRERVNGNTYTNAKPKNKQVRPCTTPVKNIAATLPFSIPPLHDQQGKHGPLQFMLRWYHPGRCGVACGVAVATLRSRRHTPATQHHCSEQHRHSTTFPPPLAWSKEANMARCNFCCAGATPSGAAWPAASLLPP